MSKTEADEAWEAACRDPLTSEDFYEFGAAAMELWRLTQHRAGPGFTLAAMQAMGDDFCIGNHYWLADFLANLEEQMVALAKKTAAQEAAQQQRGEE